jgi:hypothetical protein
MGLLLHNTLSVKALDSSDSLRDMIINQHYLKTMPRGCKYNFGLYKDDVLVGGAMFGCPVGAKVGRDTLELKRFYLTPGCEKNTASWFLSRCIKQLKGKANRIVTYADPKEGHTGALYKASNFIYKGKQVQGTPYYKIGKNKVYYRNVSNLNDAHRIKILSGEIKLLRMLPKHKFEFNL